MVAKSKKKIQYDYDALEHLNNSWKLENKIVIISHFNSFMKTNEIKPFEKNENSTFNGNMTYSWNNSYQNLKHNRATSLHFGNIKYMFDIMAALFVLNLYYKDESFSYNDGSKTTNFAVNMGSDIFSIKLHKSVGFGEEIKNIDFDECVYLLRYTNDTIENINNWESEVNENIWELFKTHPKYIESFKKNDMPNLGIKSIINVLGKDDITNLFQQAQRECLIKLKDLECQAVINKN